MATPIFVFVGYLTLAEITVILTVIMGISGRGVVSDCARFWLQAPSRQAMHYWLQQLQQKRWEYSNTRGQRDSWSSPTLPYPLTGLVGKDNGRQVHTQTPAGTISCISIET